MISLGNRSYHAVSSHLRLPAAAGRHHLILCFLFAAASCIAGDWWQGNVVAQEPAGLWTSLESPASASFRGLSAVDARIAWIGGNEGTLLRTIDGGQTFQRLRIAGGEAFDFRDLHAIDADRCCAMVAGQPARIYHTEDGGVTWSVAYEDQDERAFFNAMAFWDAQRGVAFGDAIEGKLQLILTQDGGKSWQPLSSDNSPTVSDDEHGYAASGTCLAVHGDGSAWLGLGGHPQIDGPPYARVLTSDDYGNSWRSTTTTLVGSASAGVFSVLPLDSKSLVAVGGDYRLPTQRASVLSLSRDGGANWFRPPNNGMRGFRSCVVRVTQGGSSWLLACGPSGCDYSIDDGTTWQALLDTGYHTLDVTPDGHCCWAAGADGRIAKWVLSK